jgi:hypothetical protein
MTEEFEYKVVKALIRDSVTINILVKNLVERSNIISGLETNSFDISSDDIIRNYAQNFNLDYDKLKYTYLTPYLKNKEY